MKIASIAASAISLLLLGAHFLREGAWPFVVACAVAIAALAWRNAWAGRVVQAALVLGAVEWIWTASVLVQQRMAEGRSWTRLAIILTAVALFTAVSAIALGRSSRARVTR